MALGKQIRFYREFAGWTLEKLSERSGVEVGTLNALENRDSKRSQFMSAIAAGFGLTVEQLMDEEIVYPMKVDGPPPKSYGGGESASASAPVPIKVAQRTPAYGGSQWPFETPLQQVLALSERDIGRIDGFMQAIVAGAMSPRKSAG